MTKFHFKNYHKISNTKFNNIVLKDQKSGKFTVFLVFFVFLALNSFRASASQLLIPMDGDAQKNHLKAYGITYFALEEELEVRWLLNYRGGSFLISDTEELRKECQIRGVSFEIISDDKRNK